MIAKTVRELKQGEWFTLKPIEYPKESQVYIRGEYDRGEKRFCCDKWDNLSVSRSFKGDKVVYTDFFF